MENHQENLLNGNISKWSKDVEDLQLKKEVKKNNFILIGSSMGAWISLNQFKNFKKQIKGFLGIGLCSRIFRKLNVEKIY